MYQNKEKNKQKEIEDLVGRGEIDKAYRVAFTSGLSDEKVKQAVIAAISALLGSRARGEAYDAFWRFALPAEDAEVVGKELVKIEHWSKAEAARAAKDLRNIMETLELSCALNK